MSIVRIKGAGDPRVDAYHAVQDPELVRRRGLFVAEGRLVVERLIGERRFTIQSLLLSETAFRALEPLMSEIDPARETIVHCKMGGRSARAIDALQRSGFTGSLLNLAGGITAWSNEVDPSVPKY